MTDIILAADIGGTTCKLGIFDKDLEQLHKWSIDTDTSDHTGELLLKNIYNSFTEKIAEYKYDFNNVVGVGIGVLGLLILILELYTELLIYIGPIVSM